MADATISARGFVPPARYDFEPELTGPAPRLLPDYLNHGPHLVRQRRSAVALAVFGAVCLLVSAMPPVRKAGLYFLPLAWTDWIGIGSLVLAFAAWVDPMLRAGRRRWVRDGSPLVAQVLDLVKGPSVIVNGSPTQGRFTATVAFVHPDSGVPSVAQLQSDEFSWNARQSYDTPFRVGDYVTALFLPGRFEKSLRLYSFLGLRAEHELRRNERREAPRAPWRVALLLLGVVALLTGIVGGCLAYGLYAPFDFDYWRAALPMAAGAVLIGGGLLAWLWWMHRAQIQASAAHNRRALESGEALEVAAPFLGTGVHGWILGIGLVLGAPLVGAVLVLSWLFFVNAWLDVSPPRREPVRIENLVMTTHSFLFREYEIEYAFAGSGVRAKLLSTPDEMSELTGEEGVATVRKGAFGWPWVERIEPAAEPERD